MSLVEQLHAEHKARLIRMGGAKPFVPPAPNTGLVELTHKVQAMSISIAKLQSELARLRLILVDNQSLEVESLYPTMGRIKAIVALHFGISVEDINSARRSYNICRPRQIAMYLAKTLTPRSFPQIANELGGRDHTTVIHGCRKIERLMKEDPDLHEEIEKLSREIKSQ